MTVSIALLLAAPLAAAPRPDRPPTPLTKRIDQARARTFKCQRTLGLERSPVSGTPAYGRYAQWVLALWRTRARAALADTTPQ